MPNEKTGAEAATSNTGTAIKRKQPKQDPTTMQAMIEDLQAVHRRYVKKFAAIIKQQKAENIPEGWQEAKTDLPAFFQHLVREGILIEPPELLPLPEFQKLLNRALFGEAAPIPKNATLDDWRELKKKRAVVIGRSYTISQLHAAIKDSKFLTAAERAMFPAKQSQLKRRIFQLMEEQPTGKLKRYVYGIAETGSFIESTYRPAGFYITNLHYRKELSL